MKKENYILTIIIMLAFIGGVFAYKASNYTPFQAYRTTTVISSVINGITYYKTTSPVSPFCTTTNRWITMDGPLTTTLSAAALVTGTFTTMGNTTTGTYATCITTQTVITVIP
jgi:hypothetical protein